MASILSMLQPVEHRTYRQVVSQQLLALLLKGRYSAGQRLVLHDIASQLGVSITPVREALQDLAALGMVAFRPNCGAVAPAFGPAELIDIYNFRRVLEVEAVRTACGNLPGDELLNLQQHLQALAECDPLPTDEAMETDYKLHSLIAEHCQSARLREEIKRYDLLMQTVHDLVGNENQTQVRANEEHLVIVRALLDRDVAEAVAAITDHLDRTSRDVAAILWPTGSNHDAD